MSYTLFIDDERMPSDEPFHNMVIARTMADVIDIITHDGMPTHISFDHDLGENQPTGHDIAKWLVEYDMEHDIINEGFTFYVHSQNPVGKANIEGLLNNYLDHKRIVDYG